MRRVLLARCRMPERNLILFVLIGLILFFFSANAYDLNKARVEKLENGLTVLILEDRAQPLISTQVLYKAGGRNECTGATGLAHYVEHMAFRATKNFPEGVSRIYAEGGEWHGYTWIDQTTYFETVPIEDFDMVLQLQADRMSNAVISAAEVDAERGAVMTELRGYENDPSSVLSDAVVAASFQQHPYRYNVIGWPSDVEKITHKDLVDFYRRFYTPSNAVLAISGDITSTEALFKVRKYFGAIPATVAQSEPRTVEPIQTGERRVVLKGSGPVNYFQISWRAPAANDPDYSSFLLLQTILAGATGVNFRQGGDEDVNKDSRLDGIDANLETFFFSSADPYLFTITGHLKVEDSRDAIEEKIESKIAELREHLVTDEELEKAKSHLKAELIFDLETTEDAAHQMAFFEGVGAFSVLQQLPDLIGKVSAEEIKRTAAKYLQPHMRTIGWYLGDSSKSADGTGLFSDGHKVGTYRHRFAKAKAAFEATVKTGSVISEPHTKTLKNGISVIVQKNPRSPAGFIRVIVPSNTIEVDGDYDADNPLWGYTSVTRKFLKDDLSEVVTAVRKLFDKPFKRSEPDPALSEDPESRLNSTIEELLGLRKRAGFDTPILIVLVGDVEEENAFALLSRAFGNLKSPEKLPTKGFNITEREKIIRIPGKAQSQLGYAVPAAAPSESMAPAWKMLRYIMTHDYEGRLGMELISKLGLLYGISSGYRSDGQKAWVWLTTGVNPDKLPLVKQKFQELMRGLVSNPPSSKEIAEAKNHLIGRRKTAYQSNEEISGLLAGEWIEQGKMLTEAEFERRVNSISDDQLRSIIPQFLAGVTVIIDCSI